MQRVVHFEINADDPQRAVDFYKDVFDWEFQKWDGPVDYWLATTGEKEAPGIDGAITPRNGAMRTVNTVDVGSVDDFTKKVTDAGGTVIQEKNAVPGVGWFAYCADTEGNVFGLMEEDETAK